MTGRQPNICLVWEQFAAYHDDRCEALAAALDGQAEVIGLEIASRSDSYSWAPTGSSGKFTKVTLFPGANANRQSWVSVAYRLARALFTSRADVVFVCGYEKVAIFAVALLVRMFGTPVIIMNDSKFSDKPRILSRENLKRIMMAPYRGGLASGRQAADYMRFLGVKGPIALGYDTVSIDRLRRIAGEALAPDWHQRPFLIVARLVPKKNLFFALDAFKDFVDRAQESSRRLRICGGGELEARLKAHAASLGIGDRVTFVGSLTQAEVAQELAGAFCLLLPSDEEQWGLVVNEALAFGLPVIASDRVGACDQLVQTLRNGWVLGLDDARTWADAMLALDRDVDLHGRYAAASRNAAPIGDVTSFVAGCQQILSSVRPRLAARLASTAHSGAPDRESV